MSRVELFVPDPADVELVSEAWKAATCPHFRDTAVCLPCQSTAILRALNERYELTPRAGAQ
ncbi:hypothetical protein OOJ91_13915 [Micromonospora lupini]|uniref:hypothetical protein n=1 Tax=Micromonospora lupini TaxID=285679 RepID=UPI0022537D57|nr:hypothetical protein [Micromonospora lupini]MCX5066944.1 hypothetical protein [Micromonospora lupini]